MAYRKFAALAAVATVLALGSAPAYAEGDAAKGEKVSKKCKACHTFDEGGKNKVGPNQFAVMARPAGTAEGFKYSKDFVAAAEKIGEWDDEELMAYLLDPSKFLTKTLGKKARGKMTFKLKKEKDRADVIAYLKTLK